MSAFPREPSQKRTCEIFRCIKLIPICVLQRATINVDDHFVLTSAQIDVTSWTKELQIKHGKTWSGSFMMTFKQSTAVLAIRYFIFVFGLRAVIQLGGSFAASGPAIVLQSNACMVQFFCLYSIWYMER